MWGSISGLGVISTKEFRVNSGQLLLTGYVSLYYDLLRPNRKVTESSEQKVFHQEAGAIVVARLVNVFNANKLYCQMSSAEVDFHLITSPQQEERKNELFARLETLRQDVQNDTSSDVDWPTDQACKDAKLFIRLLPLSEILSPKIYFAHDGEINFLWKRQDDDLHVDLGFYGNGTYSYFATNNNKEELMDDGVNISQGLPDKLRHILRS